jgi:hypothetical protein
METMAARLLYVVTCAAPPAQDLHLVAPHVRSLGWDLCIVPTPDAIPFLDLAALCAQTTLPIRCEYRRLDEEKLPPPDAMLVAPMTYNSVNKWAAGIADTFALGLLAETIGGDIPVTAVPWAKSALTRHPAFGRSLDLLTACGASIITGQTSTPLHPALRVPDFPWQSALNTLTRKPELRHQVASKIVHE